MTLTPVEKSGHSGKAITTYPDVHRMPGAPTPMAPTPYPTNFRTTSRVAMKSGGGSSVTQLKAHLNRQHQALMSMPAGDATRWHSTLDDYVLKVAELYKTLSLGGR